ncbi:hypothetical protein K502DRAFT_125947 [Neoconidiobolus thromboides FSU 785]|nr:hypothetical protein K502DRAFT_125947 [Neoconidiobolus thromboides FSU 785]
MIKSKFQAIIRKIFGPNEGNGDLDALKLSYLNLDNEFYWNILNAAGKKYQMKINRQEIYLLCDSNELHVQMNFEEIMAGKSLQMKFMIMDGVEKNIATLIPINSMEWQLHTMNNDKTFSIKLRGDMCKIIYSKENIGSYMAKSSIEGTFKLYKIIDLTDRILIVLAYALLNHLLKCFLTSVHPDTKNSKRAIMSFDFGKIIALSFGKKGYEAYLNKSFIEDGFAKEYNFTSIFGTVGQFDLQHGGCGAGAGDCF